MPFDKEEKKDLDKATVKLVAIPDGLFTVNYSFFKEDIKVASLERKMFSLRLKGTIVVDGVVYSAYTTGIFSGVFNLDKPNGENIAVARLKKFFSNTYDIYFNNRCISMKLKYWSLKTRYELFENEELLGRICTKSLFSRQLIFESNRDWPLEIESFIMWLAILFISANDSADNSNM